MFCKTQTKDKLHAIKPSHATLRNIHIHKSLLFSVETKTYGTSRRTRALLLGLTFVLSLHDKWEITII